MFNKILKRKSFWLVLVISAISLCFVLLHFHLQKRAVALEVLKESSNVSVKSIPPAWVAKVPASWAEYMKPSFPLEVSFSTSDEDDFSLLMDDIKQNKLEFSQFINLLKQINNIKSLSVTVQESVRLDALLELDSLESITIIANRLRFNKVHSIPNLNSIEIRCTDISENFYKTIGNSRGLKVLKISTSDFITAENLKELGSLSNLKIFQLNGIKCQEEDLSFMKNINSLESLALMKNEKLLDLTNYSDVTHDGFLAVSGLALSGVFAMNSSLRFLNNLGSIKEMEQVIILSPENLRLLSSYDKVPTAYYRFSTQIDDEYLRLLEIFANKLSAEQSHVLRGLLNQLNLENQSGVTDKSVAFLKKYRVPHLNLHGTGITRLKELALDYCNTIRFPASGDLNGALELLTAKEYEVLDFSKIKLTEEQLEQILTQTHPKLIYLSGNHFTEKTIDTVMNAFEKQPKAIMKVCFSDMEIPASHKKKFLNRVHQWGMSVVYSSHIDKEFSLEDWHLQTKRTIVHDKVGNLKDLPEVFPRLKTITLKGKSATEEEWSSLKKLPLFDSLYLESSQSGTALNKSGIIKKLENFDIKNGLSSPVEFVNSVKKTKIRLNNNSLKDIASFSNGSPGHLVIEGTGILNLDIFQGAQNIKELYIGIDIIVKGGFPKLTGLKLLKINSPLSSKSLKSINQLKNLSILSVEGTNMNKEILTDWATNLNTLKSLDLSTASLGNKELIPLAEFKSLQVLDLPSTEKVTPEILKTLLKSSTLLKLNFLGTAIYSEHVKKEYGQPGTWDYEL
jgi:hypothetical protein